MNKVEFEVVTPERRVVSEPVEQVILPAAEGYMGVLPGHAPLLTSLSPGEICYRVNGVNHFLAVSTGFAEILPDRVSILASTCERADEIDLDRAREAKARAEKILSELEAEHDFVEAGIRLQRATARIQVGGRRGQ